MSTAEFNAIVEDFEFIDDWEDRYRYIIEKGKNMPFLDDALKVEATKVDGCASQVWMHPTIENDIFYFDGDSDAIIVRGLISLLKSLYNGVPLSAVLKIDAVIEAQSSKSIDSIIHDLINAGFTVLRLNEESN